MSFALTTGEQITRQIDRMVEEVWPGAGRRPMYGGIVFEAEPGKAGSMICGHFIYKNHVNLEFAKGAELDDPHNVLEGRGKYRRHIKMTSPCDLETKCVRTMIEQAFAANG